MALRLIELFIPKENSQEVEQLLKEHQILGVWREHLSEGDLLVRILLPTEETEAVLDIFEKTFSNLDRFRIILLRVEASIPRPKPPEETTTKEALTEPEKALENKVERISREELYADVVDSAKISIVYVVMVILSSIVAAIGLLHNNITVIIGAMVIAPLLGPNVALSLATTLGDIPLIRSSLKANAAGIIIALILSILLGIFFTVDPGTSEIASRTRVGLIDIVLALASGSAGALSFTTGVPAVLIGVMVAVALLPPVVTLGMLLGAGYLDSALGAMLLLFTNLICVNLAGVVTFLAQGVRPITWWEADRAKKATRIAIILWIFLLSVLVGVIVFSHKRG